MARPGYRPVMAPLGLRATIAILAILSTIIVAFGAVMLAGQEPNRTCDDAQCTSDSVHGMDAYLYAAKVTDLLIWSSLALVLTSIASAMALMPWRNVKVDADEAATDRPASP